MACGCSEPPSGPVVIGEPNDEEAVLLRVGPIGWRGLEAGALVRATGTKVAYGLDHGLLLQP